MRKLWPLTSLFLLLFFPNLIFAKSLPDKYPRLANYYLDPEISTEEAKDLAKWDLVIIGIEHQYKNPEIFSIMKEINPDIIILAYVPSEEVPEKYLEYNDHEYPQYQLYSALFSHEDWYLKDSSQNYLYFWPGHRMLNVASGWNEYLPQWLHDNVTEKNNNKWDGIYYDNCFNDITWLNSSISITDSQWKDGMNTMLEKSRELEGSGKFIVCNSSGNYYTYINGRLIEAFPSSYDGGWTGAMKKYFNVIKEGKKPSLVIINSTSSNGEQDQWQEMRYNLASAMLNDGYASFDKSQSSHAQTWWYDEYSVVLGNPLNSAYNVSNSNSSEIKNGLWRRDFEQGVVLLNSSSETKTVKFDEGFEKINGTQDPSVNDGSIIGSVKVPPNDGLILLGRITAITYARFINGSYAKIYNEKGKIKRNSFFSYDSSFSGGQTIIKLPDVNKTVVTNNTYVQVYKSSKLLYQFAPYGASYNGGINIAVDRLYAKNNKGKYYIVTGSKIGSQVRIFDLTGKLKNPGFFPYGSSYTGGVSVAIGEFHKSNKTKEIIVSPSLNAGPHVKIYSNKFKLLNPGFMAYDKSMRTGINVASGDVNNDNVDEIITGTNLGAGPQVRIFNKNGKLLNSFFTGNKNSRNGVLVSASDIEGDGVDEIIASSFNIYSY